MTIDELLKMARAYTEDANRAITEDGAYAQAETYAQIAQACAQTVQATIMAQLARTAGLDTAIRVFQ